jgi:hypothetical protein
MDGNNDNDGSANDAGHAFATIQKAVNVVTQTLDIAQFTVTIKVADGTYTTGVVASKYIRSAGGKVEIVGDIVNPANVLISTTSHHCFNVLNNWDCSYIVRGFKLQTTTYGFAFIVNNDEQLDYEDVEFGACASGHIYAVFHAYASCQRGAVRVSGGAPFHILAEVGGFVYVFGRTITYANNPVFSSWNVGATRLSHVTFAGLTFVGEETVAGKRYQVSSNSVIDTGGGCADYIPGSLAGTAATGGQYV